MPTPSPYILQHFYTWCTVWPLRDFVQRHFYFDTKYVRGGIVGPAVSFSESPNVLKYPPPMLGQHTVEILQQELQYDESRIKELEQSKIIQQN